MCLTKNVWCVCQKTLISNGKRVFEDMMITHRISIDYFCSFFLYMLSHHHWLPSYVEAHTVYRQKVLVTFKKSLFFMQKSYRLIENFNFKCLLCEFSFVYVLYAEKNAYVLFVWLSLLSFLSQACVNLMLIDIFCQFVNLV